MDRRIRQMVPKGTMMIWVFVLPIIIGVELGVLQGIVEDIEKQHYLKAREAFRCAPLAFVKEYEKEDKYKEFIGYANAVLSDMKYAPVQLWYQEDVAYEDSFGSERTYGGERMHEGTDFMAIHHPSGEIPIVSMTDGVVKNKGWLKLGGYRIGVLSDNGIYYYYAHLDSYAPGIEIGDRVMAGEFLGMMGDSGYGEEGTRGQFPVHLHLGIYYYDAMGNEISMNPFPFVQRVYGK